MRSTRPPARASTSRRPRSTPCWPPGIAAFRAARSAVRGGGRAAVAESAAAQWRALLLQRALAFQARGLDGIAPYARRGGTSDPAMLLPVAAGDAPVVATLG